MTDRDDFLTWVQSTLYAAEVTLHNGDAAPRRALWYRSEPVSVLGAWRNANGQQELHELFSALERSFSDCTSYALELQAFDVTGDMAYTVGLEHTSASIDGQPRRYTLRATQVYRRENGDWKICHRHADMVDLDRLMHEDPANARILAWLGTGERDRLRPFHGLGFDQGGVDLLLRYGRDLPDACKWSLGVANLMVHPVTGVIFAVHYGRYTFLVRRPSAPDGRPPFAETLDGTIDLRGLEDEWWSWSFEDDDEIAELHAAYAHAGPTNEARFRISGPGL